MIEIDSDMLLEYGKDFETLAYNYFAIINKTFNRIANMPNVTGEWVGDSSNRFAKMSSIDKSQYMEFYRVSRQYSTYMKNVAIKIENLCNRVKKK